MIGVSCRSIAAYKPMAPTTEKDSIETTLFLLGDAGDPGIPGRTSLDGLRHAARSAQGNVVVAFLGDNAYPNGLPDSPNPGRAEAESRLDAQVSAVRDSKARGIFVPGNHDWGSREDTGSSAILREAEYVTKHGKGSIEMLPSDGCPGPSIVDIGDRLRLILLDTEWWLQRSSNDASPNSHCDTRNERDVIVALDKALASAGERHSIVAAHHPLISGGAHGGHFGWRDHIFPLRDYSSWLWLPLPALGSAYPMMRERGLWLEDATNSANRKMREALDSVFTVHPPLVYAAGHEHNLQVMDGTSAKYLIVSGAGSQGMLNPVFRLPETRFARQATGFMRLDIMRDRRVRLSVLTVDNLGRAVEAYAMWLT
jgi:hypothetical protein